MSEPLARLLAELEAMSPRDRTAVLSALTPTERARCARLRRLPGDPGDDTDLSPWLAGLAQGARASGSRLTPATRDALLRAIAVPGPEPRSAGRSLAGAIGGLLAPRGGAK